MTARRRWCALLAGLVLVPLLQLAAAPSAQASPGPDWLPFKGSYANAVGCTWNNGCGGGYHGYGAIDFMVPYGTPVYAAGDGNLTGFGGCAPDGGPVDCGPNNFGNAVKITHASGRDSWYAHLSSVARGNGAVKAGDLIGHTGNSGKSYGSHLHYEERPAGGGWGSQVDPGAMNALHDGRTVSYPGVLGYSSWNSVPCGVQYGEPCTARHTVRSDGVAPPPPPGSQEPFGHVDQAQSGEAGRVHVAGWAIDDDARTSPVTIHAYVGGEAGAAGAEGHDLGPANVSRPDVGAAHAGAGDHHGFDTAFTTGKTGAQPVCVYAINIGGGNNPLLGCKTVTIQDPQPFGSLDTADGGAGTVHVRGWAVDRNTGTAPITVHVYIGGPAGAAGAEGHDIGAAASDRPDVGAAHPWAGAAHGFDTSIATQKRGTQQVCAYAIDVGPGDNQLLGCRSTTISDVPAQAPAELVRLSGADRLGTAIAISKDAWSDQQAHSVVLARHDAFPDALAGTPLAVAKRGPLLLTPSTGLASSISSELQRVLPVGRTVYLLGGASALSQGVSDAVTRLGYEVARLGGADRYATAITINRQLGTPTRVFEATGLSFQNALISGVTAAGTGGVVVLTADGKMPAVTKAYLDSFPAVERVAVGAQAGAADPGAVKVAGASDYDTARLLAERYFPSPGDAALASGTVFADALAGGAHIGKLGGPLLLSEPARLPSEIAGYLSGHRSSIDTVTLYGGTVALSTSVEDAVRSNLRK